MKRIGLILSVIFSMIFLAGCPEKPIDSVSKKEADEMVEIYVQDEIEPNSNEIYAVYYFNKLDINHVEIKFWEDSDKLIVENSYIYFIDEYEMANLGHPCRFMIIDKTTGNYRIHHRNAPPQTDFHDEWTLLFSRKQ